jgi:phage tail-like protein
MSAGQQSISGAVDASAHDPFRGFKFQVTVAGLGNGGSEKIGFQSVAGLSQETEVVEYSEGTDPVTARKLPGPTTYEAITLARGLSRSRFLLQWRNQVISAEAYSLNATVFGFRREVTIELFDKGAEANFDFSLGRSFTPAVATWEVTKAWPSSLKISDLDAGSSDVVVETLVLAHEGWAMR